MLNNLFGNSEAKTGSNALLPFMSEGEEIFTVLKMYRDEIAFTCKGIYIIDVQGMTGKKVSVTFVPKKHIEHVTFETAGVVDMDCEIGLTIRGMQDLKINIARKNSNLISELVIYIKDNYLA